MKEEKYIKDKLSNYDSPMDMDAMWADLEKNLNNEKDEKPIFWLFRFGRKFFFLAAALLISLAAFSYLYINNQSNLNLSTTTDKTSSITQLKNNSDRKPNTTLNKESEINTSQPDNNRETEIKKRKGQLNKNLEFSTTPEPQKTKIQTKDLKKETTNKPVIKPSDNATAPSDIKENKKLKPKQQNQNNSQTISGQKDRKTKKKNDALVTPQSTTLKNKAIIPASTITVLKQKEKTKNSSINLMTPIALLASYNFIKHNRNIANIGFENIAPAKRRILVKEQAYKWRANFSLAQTVSYFSHEAIAEGFSVTVPLANMSATNNLGFGIGLDRKTKTGLLLSTGVNYINHGAIYSYFKESTETRESNKVTIYTDQNNNFLGATEQEVEITSSTIRAYRQYKKLHSVQLPLTVGKEWQKNKMDFSIAAGTACNYFFSQSNHEVEETSQLLNYKLSALKFSLKARAEIGYTIRTNYRLFAAIEGGRLLGRLVDVPIDLSSYISTQLTYGGLKAGVGYAF